jgi:phosphoglycolate phosphatase-like HAD superfamily hydrolase
MKRPKAVFFDVDGVLLDSLPAHLKICEDLSQQYGLGLKIPSPEEFKQRAQKGVRISPMKYFFMAVGFGEKDAERADGYYRKHFMEKYRPVSFPSVDEVLEKLSSAGLALGIVTSNVRVNIEQALGKAWSVFDARVIYTYDRTDVMTKGQALRAGVHLLGVRSDEALFVGDQQGDWTAANEADVRFLGVTYGWGISRDQASYPTVDRPEQIADHVLKESK